MRYYLMALWVNFGYWAFGFPMIDIYLPDDNVVGVTFSKDEKYIKHVQKYEI